MLDELAVLVDLQPCLAVVKGGPTVLVAVPQPSAFAGVSNIDVDTAREQLDSVCRDCPSQTHDAVATKVIDGLLGDGGADDPVLGPPIGRRRWSQSRWRRAC